jgi:hypothetical protein
MSSDKSEKSSLRVIGETLLAYATANVIVTPVAAPIENHMLSIIQGQKVSRKELLRRTYNGFFSYARWQGTSAVAGGGASLAWDHVSKPSNNDYVNATVGAVFAGTCETGATIYDEVKSKVQGLDLKNTKVTGVIARVGLLGWLRNIVFWDGVALAAMYSKQNDLKPVHAGIVSFVGGLGSSVMTMPLLNYMVKILSDPTCKVPAFSRASLFLGLTQRMGVLTIYTVANNPLNDHVKEKYSDKIDEKLEKHKDVVEHFEKKGPDIAARFIENHNREAAANWGLPHDYKSGVDSILMQKGLKIDSFAEKISKAYKSGKEME